MSGGENRWKNFPICQFPGCDSRTLLDSYCSLHVNECACGCGGRCLAVQRYITGHGKGRCARCDRSFNNPKKGEYCSRCLRTLERNPEARFNDTRQKNRDAPPGKKWCARCRRYRLHRFFSRNKQAHDGLHHCCKPCQREAAAENRLRKRYGITPDEYDKIKEHQGGVCFICQRSRGVSKALSVDHDHSMERDGVVTRESIRGLLCSPCNRFLGFARDDPDFFARIIEYLTSPPARKILNIP